MVETVTVKTSVVSTQQNKIKYNSLLWRMGGGGGDSERLPNKATFMLPERGRPTPTHTLTLWKTPTSILLQSLPGNTCLCSSCPKDCKLLVGTIPAFFSFLTLGLSGSPFIPCRYSFGDCWINKIHLELVLHLRLFLKRHQFKIKISGVVVLWC